ncbi:hypothetical protein TEPIDINF_001813 [Tepidibacillus infernus]|uniref:hypothetical protein n=1 Tax=Tepidibacillus TaxID=1494427 RepID=UPI000852FFB2|nr:hypothetical protein [Tepidibacillus sp. HK-1]GBF10168.1 hypothetical protein HK1_00180 [Tepidibacillus sp. HK-1]
MAEQKPTKKDFVDLINTVMGTNVMTEDQLTRFLNEAKHVKDTSGTEGLLEYVQRVTNAPTSKDQLKKLANQIQQTGSAGAALDFLKNENLLTEQQARKLNKAIEQTAKKKKKK